MATAPAGDLTLFAAAFSSAELQPIDVLKHFRVHSIVAERLKRLERPLTQFLVARYGAKGR